MALLVTVKVHKPFGFLDAVQQKGLIKYEQGGCCCQVFLFASLNVRDGSLNHVHAVIYGPSTGRFNRLYKQFHVLFCLSITTK